MNDKISSELFSSIISNINQIPNNSTPIKVKGNSKQSQKLLQLYQIYNIDSSSQTIFTKLFSYINDYYLKNNLIKIMANIGTKYYSFSISAIILSISALNISSRLTISAISALSFLMSMTSLVSSCST